MYSFDSTNRLAHVRAFRALTSPVIVTTLLASALLAFLSWILFSFIIASSLLLALATVSTSIAAGALLLFAFGTTYYPYRPPPASVTEFQSKKSRRPLNVAQASSFALIQAIGRHGKKQNKKTLNRAIKALLSSFALNHFISRLELNRQQLFSIIQETALPELTWPLFAEGMLAVAARLKQPHIEPEHALGALLLHSTIQARLRSFELTENDILFALWWGAEHRRQRLFKQRWWDRDRLLGFTGIGLSWASGFTPFVDRFARLPQGSYWDDVIFGHEGKVSELINTLARQRQSNVLLVGDPGVGRIGIIRSLAKRVRTNSAHEAINGQRVLYINLGELAAQSPTSAGQLSGISKTLREMERADNIIAVIDGISSVLGGAGEQRANLTDLLLPFLSSMTVRVVVITSSDEYHLRLKSNQELAQYFEVVQIPGLSNLNTMKRLALTAPLIEKKANLTIPYKTIRTLVEDTESILPHIPFPERAFDFLEEAIVLAQTQHAGILKPNHIHPLISRKIGIDFGSLRAKEKKKLLNLENTMHHRMVNQDSAIKTVVRAMIRARAQVTSKQRPIGTFLFLGPTGVGKTETAKTLAEAYFGSEEHMVRLDMSEFQGSDGVARLIGSAAQPVGRLTSLIADHPFTVLLLDEFEKADEQVHQLFLQVFDEGHLTDAAGRKYSFLHSIIIATSNAGAELIRQEAKDGKVPDGFSEQLKEHILQTNIFRPELLNRFDSVVTYSTLSIDHIHQIAKLMLRKLNKRLDAEHGITVNITNPLINYLVDIGYHPEFGARPMTRAIQNTVEYAISQMILKNQTQPGQQITLQPALLRTINNKQ